MWLRIVNKLFTSIGKGTVGEEYLWTVHIVGFQNFSTTSFDIEILTFLFTTFSLLRNGTWSLVRNNLFWFTLTSKSFDPLWNRQWVYPFWWWVGEGCFRTRPWYCPFVDPILPQVVGILSSTYLVSWTDYCKESFYIYKQDVGQIPRTEECY